MKLAFQIIMLVVFVISFFGVMAERDQQARMNMLGLGIASLAGFIAGTLII